MDIIDCTTLLDYCDVHYKRWKNSILSPNVCVEPLITRIIKHCDVHSKYLTTHFRFILFLYMCSYYLCIPVYENKFRGLRRCVKWFSFHFCQQGLSTPRTTLILQHENILHISYFIFATIPNVYLFYWLNVRENARIITTFELILYVMYKFKSTKNVFCI